MTAGKDRHWRKSDSRRARTMDRRSRFAVRCAALAVCAVGALGAIPAQASTGGASPIASSEAEAGQGFAFGAMRSAGATWYGPGLYGRHTACGQTLRPSTIGVAHRSLPCGTAVKFVYHGHSIVAQVIDRGPYSKGNSWDLTSRAAEVLGFSSAGQARIRYAVALSLARH
jgi:rare lipoprotein A (peptidoglycan hydrolase)